MDKIFEVNINEEQVGDRIDKFLSLSIPSLSRTNIQTLIKNGNVLVNGKEVKPSYKVDLNFVSPEFQNLVFRVAHIDYLD